MVAWTEERDEQLRVLYKTGLSTSLIAERMGGGLSRNAIIGRVHRLKLPLRGSAAPSRVEASRRRRKNRERFEQGKRAEKPNFKTKKPALPPAPRVVVLPPEPPQPPDASQSTDFMDLRRGQCRWPMGEHPFQFCGSKQTHGSYCEYHARVAYQPKQTRTNTPGPLWR